MITVQADSCLNSDQVDTLFISVGGQEGGWGGGVILGWRPRIYTRCHSKSLSLQSIRLSTTIYVANVCQDFFFGRLLGNYFKTSPILTCINDCRVQ